MKRFLFLIAVVFALCGCESWSNKNHLTIALMPWGTTYYSNCNFEAQADLIKKNLRSNQQYYLSYAAPENRDAANLVLKKLAYANLWLEHSGVYNLEKIEECSKKTSDDTFRNELLLKFKKDSQKGFLEELFNTPNQDLAYELAIITDETVFCANLQLNLKDALAKYPKTEEFKEFDNILKTSEILDLTLTDLVDTADGNWGVLINAPQHNTEATYEFSVSIPDKTNKLYEAIGKRIIDYQLGQVAEGNPNKLILRPFGKYNPIVVKKDGYVWLYSSEKAIGDIVKNVKENEYAAKLQKLQVPEEVKGNGFIYFNKVFCDLVYEFVGSEFLAPDTDMEGLTIIRNQGKSYLLTQYADVDWNYFYGNELTLLFGDLLNEWIVPQLQLQSAETQIKKDCDDCVKFLKNCYLQSLLPAKNSNGGKFPTAEVLSGKYDSNLYCYIAANFKGDQSKLPLLFDRKNNHGNFINVLFADGSVRTFELENVASAKRVLSYLHSIYRYDAQIFAELLKQAK